MVMPNDFDCTRSPVPKPLPRKSFNVIYRIALVAMPLLFAAYALHLRHQSMDLPQGDEGSWMAVATQFSEGKGYTTMWLEHHWLKPYSIPRPDDFRYPGLTTVLGIAFYLGHPSVALGRNVVAALFLLFALSVFLVIRRHFGFKPALLTLWLTCVSLFQHSWNAAVYTEGLYGLALAGIILALFSKAEKHTVTWGLRLGMALGLLYCVRPNGILMLSGVFGWLVVICLALVFENEKRKAIRTFISLGPTLGLLAGLSATAGLWMARTAYHFGSPFHIAGSAGLLRDHGGESHLKGVAAYFSQHSPLFPVRRIFEGGYYFFQTLHGFEHGLEIFPLLLVLAGSLFWFRHFKVLWRGPNPSPANIRSLGYSLFLVIGFGVSFLACCYAAWHSWAGIRYFSSYIPFIYGLGIGTAYQFLSTKMSERQLTLLFSAAFILMLLPVINPHRFYYRQFSQSQAANNLSGEIHQYTVAVKGIIPIGSPYYAKSLCQLNFLTGRSCVGLQELYDTTWFARSESTFKPGWIAIATSETSDPDIAQALSRLKNSGASFDTVYQGPKGFIMALRR